MNADTKHTAEPWRKVRSQDRLNPHDIGIARDGIQAVLAECYAEFHAKGDVRPAECEANAARIVACVNALAGLNPEAVPALVEAAEAVDGAFTTWLAEYATGPDEGRALRSITALRAALAAVKGVAR